MLHKKWLRLTRLIQAPSNPTWLATMMLTIAIMAIPGTPRAAEPASDKEMSSVKVMTFNIWVGGEGRRQPLDLTAKVITASGADIVGLQEAKGQEKQGEKPDNGRKIAEILGWNYVAQDGSKAILSRFEIGALTPEKQGAEILLPTGQVLHFFNVHLFHAPYQPYQLLGIPYEDAPFLDNADALVAAAEAARGPEFALALNEMAPLIAAGELVVLTGDFNEPSHLDWTEKGVAAGIAPLAVPYPASRAAESLGLIDVYRKIYPDEGINPGYTWTPTTAESDPADHHDRIDFIYVSSALKVMKCQVIGESPARADIVVNPYPSDHRSVAAVLELPALADAKQ